MTKKKKESATQLERIVCKNATGIGSGAREIL
jgi:hypothetical protein